jgi:D-psicose/D-tagatose/L-ribulose 3-epimerase
MERVLKISLSNLAFKDDDLETSLKFIESSPIQGLEIAPATLWSAPAKSSVSERSIFLKTVMSHGLKVIGLQAILFDQPNLQVFQGLNERALLAEHLISMLNLCKDLGGSILSFGSYRNRKLNGKSTDEALEIASEFFFELACSAEKFGVCVVLESIPVQYGCDFITDTDSAADLVHRVNHKNFRLMLDTGNMRMGGESCLEMLEKHHLIVDHVHVNDPELKAPSNEMDYHQVFATQLKNVGYRNWVTLEFLSNDFQREIEYAIKTYC